MLVTEEGENIATVMNKLVMEVAALRAMLEKVLTIKTATTEGAAAATQTST